MEYPMVASRPSAVDHREWPSAPSLIAKARPKLQCKHRSLQALEFYCDEKAVPRYPVT